MALGVNWFMMLEEEKEKEGLRRAREEVRTYASLGQVVRLQRAARV